MYQFIRYYGWIFFVILGVIGTGLVLYFLIKEFKTKLSKEDKQHLDSIIDKFRSIVKLNGGALYEGFSIGDKKNKIQYLILSRGGLCSIEVNFIEGKLLGDKDSEKWQIVDKKQEIENPLKNNQSKSSALSNLIGNDITVSNYVLFVKADLAMVSAPNALNEDRLINKLEQLAKSQKYSPELVNKVNQKLQELKYKK